MSPVPECAECNWTCLPEGIDGTRGGVRPNQPRVREFNIMQSLRMRTAIDLAANALLSAFGSKSVSSFDSASMTGCTSLRATLSNGAAIRFERGDFS